MDSTFPHEVNPYLIGFSIQRAAEVMLSGMQPEDVTLSVTSCFSFLGLTPNMMRTAIVNTAEIVSYDVIKSTIVRRRWMTDNVPCHFISALGAGQYFKT